MVMTKKQVEQAICQAFDRSFTEVMKLAPGDDIRHINESVYRFLFMKMLEPDIRKEDEWRRIDLLLNYENEFYPIEFKFYDRRQLRNFKNNSHTYKGGPGKQNFKEFLHSCTTLFRTDRTNAFANAGVHYQNSYFILIAVDHPGFKIGFLDDYSGKHIIELKKRGIHADELTRRTESVDSKTIFGWVLRLTKKKG